MLTFGPSWDNMRHAHNSVSYLTRLTSWLMWPHRTRKTWTEKNTTESSNGPRFTFWQIYNWLWNMLFKKFIAPEQINMSFTFTYIKCQAKHFKPSVICYYFLASVFLSFLVFHPHGWILLIGFLDCQYLYWKEVP